MTSINPLFDHVPNISFVGTIPSDVSTGTPAAVSLFLIIPPAIPEVPPLLCVPPINEPSKSSDFNTPV